MYMWQEKKYCNTCMLDKNFSQQYFEILILFFLEYRLCHFMQIVIFPSMFSWRNKKNTNNFGWKKWLILSCADINEAYYIYLK